MTRGRPAVVVLGATGFVGRHVAAALETRGCRVRRVSAPRLRTPARDLPSLQAGCREATGTVDELREQVRGSDAVVNAAGMAQPGASESDDLYGANALLPLIVAEAVSAEAVGRFVHVSSAAVQGKARRLTESLHTAPFSPYGFSKALGEAAIASSPDVVIYRATSVHGRDRKTTRTLRDVATSRWATVASPGDRATPQVLVQNLASGVAFVATTDIRPPVVVLQPSEGITTAELLTLLGGRQPREVPAPIAHALAAAGAAGSRLSPRAASSVRRLELLWFGQDQDRGWLESVGWSPPAGRDAWRELR